MIVLLGISCVSFGAAWFGTQAVVQGIRTRQAEARMGVAPTRRRGMGPVLRCCIGPATRFAPLIERVVPPRWLTVCAGVLRRADLGDVCTPAQWMALTVISAIAGSLAFGIVAPVARGGMVLIGFCLGGALPFFWVYRTRRRRCEQILAMLPQAIELLALSVEAGSEFLAALTRIVERAPAGPLKNEWQRVVQAVRFGAPRGEALRQMATRVELPAVTAVVTALVQADRLGAPLAPALHAQAEQLRFLRFQRAERLGAAASQKILLPIIFCILPAFVLLVLGGVIVGILTGGTDAWFGQP